MQAPFPYFGGKSAVADQVWAALGNVDTYVEPFFGSGAVLLARPHPGPHIETVNDVDGLLANFWRAIKSAPDDVAEHADWPCNEADLHARHLWLVGQRQALTERLMADPDYYDAKAAGWWVWGACNWIGGEWCSGEGPWIAVDGVLTDSRKLPHLSAGQGIKRQLPCLSAGHGINRQLPHMGDAGRGQFIREWFTALSDRFRGVRVACGDWSRVCGPSVRRAGGEVCGVFMDPPYAPDMREKIYAIESDAAREAFAWCLAHGREKNLRIVLAGYAGEHDELEKAGWRVIAWKARGGYGSQGDDRGRENATRERLWLSPNCLRPDQQDLFAMAGAAS